VYHLAAAIALVQLILVFCLNRSLGIPDIWFSMGDDVLVEFVIAVQFLPMCVMYLRNANHMEQLGGEFGL
jgi:hypothetical protein